MYDAVVKSPIDASLSIKTLTGTSWRLSRDNGLVIANRLGLEADGSVSHANSEDEHSWTLNNNTLTLYNRAGKPALRFAHFARTPLGLLLFGELAPGHRMAAVPGIVVPGIVVLDEYETHALFAAKTQAVVNRELFGQERESYNVDSLALLAAGISSSQYVMRHMRNAERLANRLSLLDFVLRKVCISGLYLEFGVFLGRTINHMAAQVPAQKFYGFDSFEGLPEEWRAGFPKGAFALPQPPKVRPNVELVVGWFKDTITPFLTVHPEEAVAFVYIDCDLYSSTRTILTDLGERIAPGTVIVFDEYLNYPGWERDEFRAFQEYIEKRNLTYRYIGLVPSHQQVAVQIEG